MTSVTNEEALEYLDTHCTAAAIPFPVKIACTFALLRGVRKKPIYNLNGYVCPGCGFRVQGLQSVCEICGQLLDWKNVDKKLNHFTEEERTERMNYMRDVAKTLGVEMGEVFDIEDACVDGKRTLLRDCWFKDSGLTQEGHMLISSILAGLILGDCRIVKKPWKPKFDETYYSVSKEGVRAWTWTDASIDVMFYKLGDCYRTAEEAKVHEWFWHEFFNSDDVVPIE